MDGHGPFPADAPDVQRWTSLIAAALATAHARGRAEGLEECLRAIEGRAIQEKSVGNYGEVISRTGAVLCEIAAAIRALGGRE